MSILKIKLRFVYPVSNAATRERKDPGADSSAAWADQRGKLERLCRYITRPAVSEQRLALTAQGKLRYQLKIHYVGGTTQVNAEPLDFVSRLAALVPKPRI